MKKRQAVVLVHGIGEQVPMQTLRSFLDAIWTTDESLVDAGKPDPLHGGKREHNAFWIKPEAQIGNYELNRITTEADANGGRTDFYEFYWAHFVADTKLPAVYSWIFDLMWRNPAKRVPRHVLNIWIGLWVAVIFGVGMALAFATSSFTVGMSAATGSLALLLTALAAVWAFVSRAIRTLLVGYVGDIARYPQPKPGNFAARQNIRAAGVGLLERLMGIDEDGDGETQYDRIVVVGHSLGCIVAYDVLGHTFARMKARMEHVGEDDPPQPALEALEAMVRSEVETAEKDTLVKLDTDQFQAAQFALGEELRAQGSPWLVTDFITLGSPLGHAEFLMANSPTELCEAQISRQLATCPPALEYDGREKHLSFSYKASRRGAWRNLHHAAVFAPTRWTNIYSPRKWLLWGDLVSGPVARVFGAKNPKEPTHIVSGVREVSVLPERDDNGEPAKDRAIPFFTHLKYWAQPNSYADQSPHHIRVLRKAVDIIRQNSRTGP